MRVTRALDRVFGKRVIVIGGGAQVAQVALGAVSEADRHNLRGERISVDTIPLVGEQQIAEAVRAVADLPRARLLVLAGSLMGGQISRAADELRALGIPVIALHMAGSIGKHVDLVVSDPVQAGTMAVMAIADTASFDLETPARPPLLGADSAPASAGASSPAASGPARRILTPEAAVIAPSASGQAVCGSRHSGSRRREDDEGPDRPAELDAQLQIGPGDDDR